MARSTARAAAARREQILKAAILRFAQQSYEDTSLRAIAADVGVDVAHVHRSFGSKEALLAEAVRSISRIERFLAASPDLFVERLAGELFVNKPPRDNDEVGPLDIFLRSLTSREASGVLHQAIMEDFIGPVSQVTNPSSARRAALIAAFALGIGVLREVLSIEPLRDTGDGELRGLTIQVLRTLVGEDPQRGPAA